MKFQLENTLNFDYSHLLQEVIGFDHGVSLDLDLARHEDLIQAAFAKIKEIREGAVLEHGETVRFMSLPYQDSTKIESIVSWAEDVKKNYKTVVSLGIGGSYLGNKTLQDALRHPYHNECEEAREGYPQIYFAGDNLDPSRLKALMEVIDVKTTKFVMISKSGGTVEPMSSFAVVLDALREGGGDIQKQITIVTDEKKGLLRGMADRYGWDSFIVPEGVGGRWTVLSEVGLLTAAATGINIQELLDGARAMDHLCKKQDLKENPSALYAFLHWLLYKNKGKYIAVMMPYSNALKSVGDWYVQLLAESLGKKYNRKGDIVHEGRTPIPAVGTTDMHAQTQQHFEGKNIRVLTFLEIENYGQNSLVIPDVFADEKEISFIGNEKMERLLQVARVSNERSLASEGRPTCCLVLPELSPFYLGQLLYFLEYATAFEGELLNVNPYDQPGVEAYKKVMKEIIGV
jgi:glucose-6-phosphate isomerase